MVDNAAERLRKRFVAARENSGLTQAEAARRLGVSEGTVSRKERGEQPVKERDAAAMERLAEQAKRPGEMVPRGTSGTPDIGLPTHLRTLAQRFEREMARLGANDYELDYIASVLASPETAKLFHMGDDGKPLTTEEQDAEFEIQLEALKLWVTRRLERRRGA